MVLCTIPRLNRLMDPVFERHTSDAASIATSGRWDHLNSRILILAANPGPHESWWVQVFGSLASQVFSEYLMLKNVFGDEHLGRPRLLAWHARSLLELSVWCIHCAKSRDNARRLYEDAGRDVRDILSVFEKWGAATRQPDEWFEPGRNSKQDLLQRAKADGIESLDGPYKEARDAAVDCGIGDHFRVSYRMLSKFAHPTAMQILAPFDRTKNELQVNHFFGLGCMYFTVAVGFLEEVLFAGASAVTNKGDS